MKVERCALCGQPAAGFARIGDERYCHDGTPSCFEIVQQREPVRSHWLRLLT